VRENLTKKNYANCFIREGLPQDECCKLVTTSLEQNIHSISGITLTHFRPLLYYKLE